VRETACDDERSPRRRVGHGPTDPLPLHAAHGREAVSRLSLGSAGAYFACSYLERVLASWARYRGLYS